MAERARVLAGAMSGTSADGVDVAIVRIEGRGLGMKPQLLHHHHRAYAPDLKKTIFVVRSEGKTTLEELARLGRLISLEYAASVNEAMNGAGIGAKEIAVIAAHGQTLFHNPPDTIQWLDPALLAAETGCAVVSDFRRADCAAGGQGAPLVPFADYILFRDPTKTRVLANIGGIANITCLPAGCALEDVVAFDTGPGNCVSDWIMRTREPHGASFDKSGQRALKGEWGKPMERIVHQFAMSAYSMRPPPKSTDGPEMIETFKQIAGADLTSLSTEDLLLIACHSTAATIDYALHYTLGLEETVFEMVVSGGGVHNQAIMNHLRFLTLNDDEIDGRSVVTSEDLGVASNAKEALAFALLGAATLDGEPSNVPGATGAKRSVVLGSITPKP